MTYTLRQRDGHTRIFWVPDSGGYVREVTDPSRPGQLGWQVCDGLARMGSTLYLAHAERLPALIRRERKRMMNYERRHANDDI